VPSFASPKCPYMPLNLYLHSPTISCQRMQPERLRAGAGARVAGAAHGGGAATVAGAGARVGAATRGVRAGPGGEVMG